MTVRPLPPSNAFMQVKAFSLLDWHSGRCPVANPEAAEGRLQVTRRGGNSYPPPAAAAAIV